MSFYVPTVGSLMFGGAPQTGAISNIEFTLLFIQGAVMLPICFCMFTYGSRFISPTEASMYLLVGTWTEDQ